MIGGAVIRLGSIGYIFDIQIGNGVCMCALYLGWVRGLWCSYAGYTPDVCFCVCANVCFCVGV